MFPFLVREALKQATRGGPPKSLPVLPLASIKEALELHPAHLHEPPIPQYQHPRTKANTRWKEMRLKIAPHHPANLFPWAIFSDDFLVTPDPSLPPWATIREGLPFPLPITTLMELLPQKLFQIPHRDRPGGQYLLAYLLGIAPQFLDLLDPHWPHKAMLALRAYCATPTMKIILAWVNPLYIARSPEEAKTLLALYDGRRKGANQILAGKLSRSPIIKAALQNPYYPRYGAPRPKLRSACTFPSLRVKEEYIVQHRPVWLYLRNMRLRTGLNPRTKALPPPSWFRYNILPPTPAFLRASKKEAQRAKAIWKGWVSSEADDILMTYPNEALHG